MPTTHFQSHPTTPVQHQSLWAQGTRCWVWESLTYYPPEMTLSSLLTIHAHSGQLQECPASYPSPAQLLPAFFPAMGKKTWNVTAKWSWFRNPGAGKLGFPHEFSVQLPKEPQVCQCLSEDDGSTTEPRVPQGTGKPAGSAFWKLSSVFGYLSTATKAGKEQKVLLPVAYVQIKKDSLLLFPEPVF